MGKPVSGLNVFQNQAGPIPLSQLDANFTAVTNALNDTATYSNYFADSSGAANTITVTVGAPLTFAYVTGILLQVKLANTNTSTTVNINVNTLGNKAVVLNDGTAPPVGSLTANSIVDLIYDGTNFRVMSQRATSTVTTGLFGDGSAAAPSVSFASDTNTGIYSVAADDIGFSTGGTLRFDISTTAFTGTLPFRGQDGSAGAPAYSFSGDTDTGMFRSGANDVRIAAGGAQNLQISSTAVSSLVQIQNADGAVVAPAYSFFNDPDTGMYRAAANDLRLVVNGVGNLQVNTSRIDALVPYGSSDGSAGAPGFTFFSDTDTGFYRDTANQIAIALGGVTAGQIAQGSFTGTLTGFTANPTGTVNYQRVGKFVTLWLSASISATSNSASMTMTGLPSVIQTSAGVEVPTAALTNLGVGDLIGWASVNAGTITFSLRDATVVGFSNSGTKGLNAEWCIVYALR